eukprot:CAMPEP_0204344238 /NCGR_PEP_ID=MMETSP0469-20131031/25483_1 /ASSEMBLY_ACC=CAM_ASM_000384 /TAXON_ID=2969 /ORGANISM="Oxyrrhis marina" /LENGTH=93 /DNA_ID=CAMNT_0051329467 /DNA_START=29 /DNA_END=306 /DNA_ORIENTATION=-
MESNAIASVLHFNTASQCGSSCSPVTPTGAVSTTRRRPPVGHVAGAFNDNGPTFRSDWGRASADAAESSSASTCSTNLATAVSAMQPRRTTYP